jgi:hypothetical protein
MDLFNFLPLKFPAWSELQLNTFMSAWALASIALLLYLKQAPFRVISSEPDSKMMALPATGEWPAAGS